MLAALVWPALFYAGAAAVSAPILIHLLARRRFKRIRWAAMDFLIDAEKRNRRRVRLEELILLLLRCAAVLLVGLLVARPFLEPHGLAAMLGGVQRTERIIVLDDSFSMGYVRPADGAFGASTNFDLARRAVRGVIASIQRQAGSDSVTLLRTSAMESPVAAGLYLNAEQVEQLNARIEALAPSQHGLDVDATMQAVHSLLDRLSGAVNATVYVVSDFQRINWIDRNARRGSGSRTDASPIAVLKEWAGEQRSIKLALVDVGDAGASNVAVSELAIVQNQLVAGSAGTVRVGIANHTPAATGAEVHVAAGSAPEAVQPVAELPAGQVTHVPIDIVFPRAGPESIRAELDRPADPLPIDNRRYLAARVNSAIRILIVNGESAGLSMADDEVALLRTALRPAGAVFSGNELQTIDDVELDDVNLSPFHAVYLCNVYRISERAAESLQRYVADGGGLVIFVGDQIADASIYNDVLYRNGQGLLPARLGDVRQAPGGAASLTDVDLAHPIVRVFSGADNPFVKRVAFYQYFGLTPAGSEQLGDDAAETAGSDEHGEVEVQSPSSGRPSNTIAYFNDPEHTPAIIERLYGRGRIVLVNTSADQEWNDWARDPSYVVAMLELTQYIARRSDAEDDLTVGAPIELTLDPSEYQADLIVRPPAYPAEAELSATASPGDDGPGLRLRWDRTDQSGVYQFVLQRRDGGDDIRPIAVNLDPLESDLTHADEAELRQALPELPFVYVSGAQSEASADDDVRRELWPLVLIGLVAVLMVEQGLAWWFGRRSG